MRGHEPIVEMRRRGLTPESVLFTVWPQRSVLRLSWGTYEWPAFTSQAQVDVHPNDPIGRIDLRFAVGLFCWVHGRDRVKVQSLAKRLAEAGAQRVMWFLFGEIQGGRPTPNGQIDSDVIAMGDSEGVAQWQA